jgi:HlyD family secretion protein
MMKWNFTKSVTWLGYCLLGLVIALIILWALRPAPLVVEVATISKGEFTQQVIEEGHTRPRDVYIVTASVAGNLQRVSWEAGDKIKKGDEVAKIFPNISNLLDIRSEQELKERIQSLTASYERATVLVASANVAYKSASADYQRNLILVKRGYVSRSEFDHQELQLALRKKEFESAQFSANAAKHELEQAKVTLAQIQTGQLQQDEHFVKILAPVDGQVLKVEHESGGPISSGEAILSIANVNELEIVADILSTDAVKIKAGDAVSIEHWGGDKPLQGTVRLVEPGGFMKISALGVEEQRVNVIIDITSSREQWANLGAEFRVEVAILVFKSQNVLQVPISALFRHNDRWAVFIISNNKARLREIAIGRRNTQTAIVTTGLSVGDKVILYPGERIADGVRIAVQK